MKRSKKGYTTRQYAYASKRLGATTEFKQDTALAVGYSPSVAKNALHIIEKTEGFHNAMARLAGETGNLVLKIYHEIETRDISKESLPTLLNAVETMARAWETFTPKQKKDEDNDNPLRAIILKSERPKTVKAVTATATPKK